MNPNKRTFTNEVEGADAFGNIWLRKKNGELIGRLSKGAAMRLSKSLDASVIQAAEAHLADPKTEGNYKFVAVIEVVIPSDKPAEVDITEMETA